MLKYNMQVPLKIIIILVPLSILPISLAIAAQRTHWGKKKSLQGWPEQGIYKPLVWLQQL